jgi:nicotinamidase-related amidase
LPAKNFDLHGNAPDSSPVALLIIDAINDLEFDEGARLLRSAVPMAKRIAALKARTTEAGIPTIYVNDNFGRWRSDFRRQVAHCLEDGVRGRDVVAHLVPDENDYFVLKPKHSGFYNTTLDLLLDYLRVRTLILTGMATDVCVLFTAADAFMRDFELVVASDCVAAITPEKHRAALAQMKTALRAEVATSSRIDLRALLRRGERAPARHGTGAQRTARSRRRTTSHAKPREHSRQKPPRR